MNNGHLPESLFPMWKSVHWKDRIALAAAKELPLEMLEIKNISTIIFIPGLYAGFKYSAGHFLEKVKFLNLDVNLSLVMN